MRTLKARSDSAHDDLCIPDDYLFTADLHFGHSKVIGYCDRPFYSVGQMDASLVASWNTVVAADDEVWVLGDLAMGRIEDSLSLAAQLLGHKHLLVGNHDKPFRGRPGDQYVAAGFELHFGDLVLELPGGTLVLACHFPYRGDSGDHDRFEDLRPHDHGDWLLHGHVHERWRQRGRMINVGVDAWGGCPVSASVLSSLIDDGENDLAPLVWTRHGTRVGMGR